MLFSDTNQGKERKLNNFFLVCLQEQKKIKALFTPTLNGIAGSVRHVSSMPIILKLKPHLSNFAEFIMVKSQMDLKASVYNNL